MAAPVTFISVITNHKNPFWRLFLCTIVSLGCAITVFSFNPQTPQSFAASYCSTNCFVSNCTLYAFQPANNTCSQCQFSNSTLTYPFNPATNCYSISVSYLYYYQMIALASLLISMPFLIFALMLGVYCYLDNKEVTQTVLAAADHDQSLTQNAA